MKKDRPTLFRLFLLWLGLTAFFQIPSFLAPHQEGDELVFQGLAQTMTWDMDHYTVMDLRPMNEFPNRLYRAPIFMHPPLFPFLLKIGASWMDPVFFGVLLNGALKLVLAILLYLIAGELSISRRRAALAGLMVVACPILGFVGSRLLSDMVYSVSLWATVWFLLAALRDRVEKNVFYAAIAFSVFLNTKFQALFFVPGFLASVVWVVKKSGQREQDRSLLRLSLVVSSLVVVFLGGVHYFRLFHAFGISGVQSLMELERPLNDFILRMSQRETLKMLVYLLAIYPLFLMMILPQSWRRIARTPEDNEVWIRWAIPGMLIVNAVLINLKWCFQQERYWAPVVPLIFLMVLAVHPRHRSWRHAYGTLAIPGFLGLLFLGNFFSNVLAPGSLNALVSPALFRFLPFLIGPGGPFHQF